MASATSSALPIRLSGKPAATLAMSPTPERSIISVMTRPGATALMETLRDAASIATERTNDSTAAFDAE